VREVEEEEKLICPIMSSFEYNEPCKRERCAWWDPDIERCVIFNLQHLFDIFNEMGRLKEGEI